MMFHADDVKPKPLDPHWPKWKYHPSGKSKLVGSEVEEKYLGELWKDSPADHGVVTHPHSDEYLAMHENAGMTFSESDVEVGEAPKAKRGRPKKEE
jgi:hypothetical protein